MKHIVLILSLLVIGCSPKGGPKQMLRMKDGREIECRLLSVRANGLVVDTSQPPAYHITNAEPGLYPFDDIKVFTYDPTSASKTIVLSSFTGLAAGATTGFIIGANELSSGETDVVNGPLYAFALGIGGTVVGAIVGAIINDLLYYSYNPSDPKDREQIAKLAFYRTSEEPDKPKKKK